MEVTCFLKLTAEQVLVLDLLDCRLNPGQFFEVIQF